MSAVESEEAILAARQTATNENYDVTLATIAVAQATLELAKQQRIANMIAAASDPTGFLAQNLDDIRMGLAGEVWEALGAG